MRVCGIDPGTTRSGVAFLVDGIFLEGMSLYEQPDGNGDRIVHWFRRFSGLVRQWRPDVIIYEDYVWQGEARTTANAPLMWQQLGAIRLLATVSPYPNVIAAHPREWREQLLGSLPHGATAQDAAVAWTLRQRLGAAVRTPVCGNDSHWYDALGVALTWWDTYIMLGHVKAQTQVCVPTPGK